MDRTLGTSGTEVDLLVRPMRTDDPAADAVRRLAFGTFMGLQDPMSFRGDENPVRTSGPRDRPLIAFDCGTDDQLLGHNRRFHEHLQQLDIKHHYAEFAGQYGWEYWDEHVQEALAEQATVLGLPPV